MSSSAGGGSSAVLLSPLSVFSPRDPGGTEASTGRQVLMGQEPFGMPPEGGSDVGLPSFLSHSRSGLGGQPATPVRHHLVRSQSVDSNPIVAFLVGEPPPPPKTPPPARRRSRSTPRVSNRGSSYSFDESTVATAESHRSVRTQQQRPVEERLRVARTLTLARELYEGGLLQVVDPPTGKHDISVGPSIQVPSPRMSHENNEPTPRVVYDQENRRPSKETQVPRAAASPLNITTATPTAVLQQTIAPLSASSSLRENGEMQVFAAQSGVVTNSRIHPHSRTPEHMRRIFQQQEVADFNEIQPSATVETGESLATTRTVQDRRRQSRSTRVPSLRMGRSFDESSAPKEEKRGFFGKLFGRNKKKKEGGKATSGQAEVRQKDDMTHSSLSQYANSLPSATKIMPQAAATSAFQPSQVPAGYGAVQRREFSPADLYHPISRNDSDRPGSIFFAHDEVSAMTAPTFDTTLRLRDPEEIRPAQSSEPVGMYWNIIGRVESVDDNGNHEPFQDPEGASPRVNGLEKGTLEALNVPSHEPVGESPLNSHKHQAPTRATIQTNLQDPSPRGFQSPVFSHHSLNDPIGESPLHKQLRGPSAFLDGSPYAQDPPLYLFDVDNNDHPTSEGESKMIIRSISPSLHSLARMDSNGSTLSIPPPPTKLPSSSPLQNGIKALHRVGSTGLLQDLVMLPPPPPPSMPPPRHSSSSSSKGRRRMMVVQDLPHIESLSLKSASDMDKTVNASSSKDLVAKEISTVEATFAADARDAEETERCATESSLKVIVEKDNESERDGNETEILSSTADERDAPVDNKESEDLAAEFDKKGKAVTLEPDEVGTAELANQEENEVDPTPSNQTTADAVRAAGADAGLVYAAAAATTTDVALPSGSEESMDPTPDVSFGTPTAAISPAKSQEQLEPIQDGSKVEVLSEVCFEGSSEKAENTVDVADNVQPLGQILTEADESKAAADSNKDNEAEGVEVELTSSPSHRRSPSQRLSRRSTRIFVPAAAKSLSPAREGKTRPALQVTTTEPMTDTENKSDSRAPRVSSTPASPTVSAAAVRSRTKLQRAKSPLRAYESSDDDSEAITPRRNRKSFVLSRRISRSQSVDRKAASVVLDLPSTKKPVKQALLPKYPAKPRDSSDDESMSISASSPVSKRPYRLRRFNSDSSCERKEVQVVAHEHETSRNEKPASKNLLTMSAAARMNAKAVAYLHSLNGDPSPRHNWRRVTLEDSSPAATPTETKRQTIALSSLSSGETEAEVVVAPSVTNEAIRVFSAYSGKFKGRKPSKPGADRQVRAESPRTPRIATPTVKAEQKRGPPIWMQKKAKGRNVSISDASVCLGYKLLRRKREEDIASGRSPAVVLTMIPKVPQPHSYFGPLDEPEPRDPILRAGRRLLSKASVPIQAAARRYLAQKEAVDRMWALLEIQSYMRRWRAEANFLASRVSATMIQKVFRGALIRTMIRCQHEVATDIQRIVRGYISALHVYEKVYRIILVQAIARGRQQRKQLVIQSYYATRIQALLRGFWLRRSFMKNRHSAIAVQAAWRMYQIRQCFQYLVVDVIICQSIVRRWLATCRTKEMKSARMNDAAATIYRSWKCYSMAKKHRRNRAATMIQSLVRAGPVRRDYVNFKASKKIQKAWRRHIAEKTLAEMNAAVMIQAAARRLPAWREYRRYRAASRIQAAVRRFIAYKTFNAYLAATRIQAFVRGCMLRTKAIRTISAVKIQAQVRGLLAYNEYEHYRAATTIQAVWRGFQAYTDFIFTLVDVIIVQRTIRGHLAKRIVRDLRANRSARTIQSEWRCWSARSKYIMRISHLITVQSIARVFFAKCEAKSLRRQNEEAKEKEAQAATRIQASWRGFWLYSHFLIMRYEAVRLQAVVRGRAAAKRYNIILGCCIMIQSMVRRHLGAKKKMQVLVDMALVGSSAARIREVNAAKRLQVWWRIVLACRKEKKAALIIERFFVMVKEEVDREIRRAQERQKQKKLRRKKRKEGEKELEEVWLQMLDENASQAEIFSVNELSSIGDKSRASPHAGYPPVSKSERKVTVRHAASSPSMKLVMRHDDESPQSAAGRRSRSTTPRKSLARQFRSLLDDDKSVDRAPKSLLDDEESTTGTESLTTTKKSSAEKYRQMYGIKTEPNRVARKSHFFGDSPPSSSKHTASLSGQPSPMSSYRMIPSGRSSGSLIGKGTTSRLGESPRHGKILVMQAYPEGMAKVKKQSLIDEDEDILGREEFGLI